jgi:hypothetical protein
MSTSRKSILLGTLSSAKKVFIVFHGKGTYIDQELKFIGVFSSKKKAQSAVADLKLKPGFCSAGKFSTDAYYVDKVQWPEGFETVA